MLAEFYIFVYFYVLAFWEAWCVVPAFVVVPNTTQFKVFINEFIAQYQIICIRISCQFTPDLLYLE